MFGKAINEFYKLNYPDPTRINDIKEFYECNMIIKMLNILKLFLINLIEMKWLIENMKKVRRS